MLTIQTKTIDNYQIITGVVQLTPCPEATKAASVAPLARLEVAKQLKAKHDEKGRCLKESGVAGKRASECDRQAGELAKVAEPERDLVKIKSLEKEYNGYAQVRKDKLGAARLCNTELIKLSTEVDAAHREIKLNNPVYNMPGAGVLVDRGCRVAGWIPESEVDGVVVPGCHAILEDSDLSDAGVLCPEGQTIDGPEGLINKWMAQGPNQATTTSGEYIPDHRGQNFWNKTGGKWELTLSDKLGLLPIEEAGDILDADLSDEQRGEIDAQAEVERLAGLSDDDRAAEYDAARLALAGQAQAMEAGLKFDGVKTYATQAKNWYDGKLVDLKSVYGIT